MSFVCFYSSLHVKNGEKTGTVSFSSPSSPTNPHFWIPQSFCCKQKREPECTITTHTQILKASCTQGKLSQESSYWCMYASREEKVSFHFHWERFCIKYTQYFLCHANFKSRTNSVWKLVFWMLSFFSITHKMNNRRRPLPLVVLLMLILHIIPLLLL